MMMMMMTMITMMMTVTKVAKVTMISVMLIRREQGVNDQKIYTLPTLICDPVGIYTFVKLVSMLRMKFVMH